MSTSLAPSQLAHSGNVKQDAQIVEAGKITKEVETMVDSKVAEDEQTSSHKVLDKTGTLHSKTEL